MPLYEYFCLSCKRRFGVTLAYKEFDTYTPACIYCQSSNVRRRFPRIRVARSDDSRIDDLADPSTLAGLEDDPQAMGRMMRKMSRELGEDMGPEFDEVIGRLESGQNPEDIEKDLPDLGSEMGSDTYAGDMMDE